MMRRYTARELSAMPTLAIGQVDDLKIDTGTVRVWLSRCGPEDGEPYRDKVTVEFLWGDGWDVEEEYQG